MKVAFDRYLGEKKRCYVVDLISVFPKRLILFVRRVDMRY